MSDPETILSNIGLQGRSLTDTLANEAITNILLQILKEHNVTELSREVGALLLEVANPSLFPQALAKHRNLVARYIIDGKMKKNNLKAAIKYLETVGESVSNTDFEKAAGIGITVSREDIEKIISQVVTDNVAELKSEGWNAQGKIFQKVKQNDAIQWADGKLVNEIMTAKITEAIGARPEKGKKKQDAPATNKQQETAVDEETLDASQYREMRMRMVQKMKDDKERLPYPHKFQTTHDLPNFRVLYDHLKASEQLEDIIVRVAGRVLFKRIQSKKLIFYPISGSQVSVQIMCNHQYYEDKEDFDKINDILRRGDIIGIVGFPARSKTGELSIVPRKIELLSPCIHMLPHPGTLREIETRYRNRYLDLNLNAEVVKTFVARSKIIQFIRRFFDARGFLEVETPTMSMLAGGATAKPFITYHNELEMNLFMRVAPELYLKQLIIGGLEKVYEIGKNYRNEGIDMTHNPEFTAIEFYWAFADYEDLMKLTEELLSTLVLELFGSYKIKYHYNGREKENEFYEIDFTPPYPRYPMIETLEKKLGIKFPAKLDSKETHELLKQQLAKHSLELPEPHTIARLLDKLVGEFIEKDLVSPGFITEHPQIMSPLAKWHRSKEGLTERFEMFIAKKEVCNAYTELNDPAVQRELFLGQQKDREAGDEEAQPVDEGFCTALEYGLPPTGGWGLGIDRLVMFLTDNNSIKEVILFPTMKPLDQDRAAQSSALKMALAGAHKLHDVKQPESTV